MNTTVTFNYKGLSDERPDDHGPTYEMPLSEAPNVGDTVFLEYTDPNERKSFKVITKHFLYSKNNEGISEGHLNIVITDVHVEEMSSRLKE